MDTGAYMANQMDNLIQSGIDMMDEMGRQSDNELISEWAGIECRCNVEWKPPFLEILKQLPFITVTTCQLHPTPPDYDRDEVAVTLLPVLVNKGLGFRLQHNYYGKFYSCLVFQNNTTISYEMEPTIAAAIKTSILALLKKENNP